MAHVDVDELGPVDYLVVEFPPGASHFTGEMAKELARLIDAGTIRLLDLLILAKDTNGEVEAMEIEDLDQLDELRKAETQLADLLAAEDTVHLAEAMEPGTVAGVLVWENTWASTICNCSSAVGRPACGFRTHPDPSDRRLAPGRGIGRILTCRFAQHAGPDEVSSAPLSLARPQS